MGKPTKRNRLASKAVAAKTGSTDPSKPTTNTSQIEPVQQTKLDRRQFRHDAFLKSKYTNINFGTDCFLLEIHENKSPKRIRKRPKKSIVNLLSLESSLNDIMTQDRELRSQK